LQPPPKIDLEQDNIRGVDLVGPGTDTGNVAQRRHREVLIVVHVVGVVVDVGSTTCRCRNSGSNISRQVGQLMEIQLAT